MNKLTKFISLCLVMVFMLSFAVPVSAASNDIKVKVVGITDDAGRELKPFYINFGSDVKPEIRSGRTLLPIRKVAEALGYTVEWKSKTQEVVLRGEFTYKEVQSHSLVNKYADMYESNYKASSAPGFTRVALDGRMGNMKDFSKISNIISITIGSPNAYSHVWSGSHCLVGNYLMDVPAMISNDRTLLPLRAVGEMMGLKVDWDNKTRTVILTASK